MTPINNLKQWFRNGLKPTQEQFWAWMDSYWHKNEKIPQTSIKGLDKSLEAKAETTTVDAKANKDATGLDDDNIIAWKEALGVGELPSNIATVDEDDKIGNTHTKEQVVELLGEKLNTPIEEGTTENFPFVVGVNEENESVKLPAGNLGKNVANSKPTSVAGAGLSLGAIWDIETNGFPLRIRGLVNKKSDPTHNLKVKMNADGQLSVSDEADVVFQMPQNATITVNHLYPPQIPERPSYADAIIKAFERAESKTWTIWGRSEIKLVDNNKPIDDFVTFNDNGYMFIKTNNLSDDIPKLKLFSNKKISDADSFQIRLEVNSLLDPEYHGGNIHTGLGYTMLEDIRANASTGNYNSFFELGVNTRTDATIFFTKVNDIIYISGYRGVGSYSTVVNTSPELGEMVFKILMNKHSNGIVRLSYKDLNS